MGVTTAGEGGQQKPGTEMGPGSRDDPHPGSQETGTDPVIVVGGTGHSNPSSGAMQEEDGKECC